MVGIVAVDFGEDLPARRQLAIWLCTARRSPDAEAATGRELLGIQYPVQWFAQFGAAAGRRRRGTAMLCVVDVLVLGPVQFWAGEDVVAIDRQLERAVLVRLALANGVPVPDGRLAEDLWGADVERPVQRLRVVVSRLRAALGAHAEVIGRTPAGYHASSRAADLVTAEAAAQRLYAARRAGDHAGVAAAAREALGRWRGAALADLRSVPYAAAEGDRLDDWRLSLTVAGLEANLELGAAGEVVTELTGLVARYPLHEPLSGLLALALYRTGRQADALDRLARLRRNLAEELGVDPAPETAALELRILDHDPILRPANAAPIPTTPVTTEPATAAPHPDPVVSAPATSFIGRGREFDTLGARLAEPGLTTLVGVAGSGKSRLAAELARAAANSGRPVAFVELAPLARAEDVLPAVLAVLETNGLTEDIPIDPDDVLPGIVAALGTSEIPAGSSAQRDLVASTNSVHTGDNAQQVLLILDNAEHLIEPVTELATAAADSSILITSQRALGVTGESVYPLGPLERGNGVALFTERAGLHGLVTVDERAELVRICAAVDWLPLGIELAAGLTRTLTISQLAQRIDDRVRLLVGGARDAGGGRHTSLRVALDWSYELLAERERTVLRRLGVFAGGCTLEAAEAVTPGADLEGGDIAPALADLVNRSLVTVQNYGVTRRFVLLETVRDYALAQLAQTHETDPLRARHVDWCLDLVRKIGEPDDFATAESVAAVFAEWPNILAALENAPGTPRAAAGLRLATAMHVPWLARAWFREARRHYGALIDSLPADTSPAELAQAQSHYGFHTLMTGDFDSAAAQLVRASEVAAPLDDIELAQTVRYYQGIVDIERAELPAAVERLREGERLAVRVTQASSFADALGTALLYSGDAAGALAAYQRSTEVDRANDDEHGLSRGLSNQAKALLDLGRAEDALAMVDESDRYARRLDDRQILPLNDLTRAAVALAAGQLDAAESYCRAALAHEEEAGLARLELADVLIAKGELDEAAALLAEHDAAAPGGVPALAARAIEVALRHAQGDPDGELVERTRSVYRTSGFGWQRYLNRLEKPGTTS
ncbi:AfsR/SARP family transcriptional regulator [Nocardia vinacea]|uniref:AfsR/SARP family transcriptional regulator n=1 Tax=Nocardia vinacea TaxID=96468 RepID=UPI0012F6854D|nr:BTAD domain-containing putative transcriptional regulator [Nocardia vinacea]